MTHDDTAIPAATILIVRDGDSGLETLMVERHADIGFAGGAMVWPGGKIEAADRDPAWIGLCDGLADFDADDRPGVVAALREAFEETGLLMAARDGRPVEAATAAALSRHRAEVDRDAALFAPLLAGAGLRLNAAGITPFARWIPPGGMHKRFDTRFFLACPPAGQAPVQAGSEAVDIVWMRPADALADLAAGRRKIIFPTARNLELLGLSDTVEAVFAAAARRPRGIVQPVIADGMLIIRDDLGYPVTREALGSAMRG